MSEKKITAKERNRLARSFLAKAVKFRELWNEESDKTLKELLCKKIYSLIDLCNEVAPEWCATFQKFDCGQIIFHLDGQVGFSQW